MLKVLDEEADGQARGCWVGGQEVSTPVSDMDRLVRVCGKC